jgi:hypothetical protein
MVKRVYQFKIVLREIEPPIWRRIQVPEEYTFWDLHVAIQDAMGWKDYHLHEFRMRPKHKKTEVRIGIIDDEPEFPDQPKLLPDNEVLIHEYFHEVGTTSRYRYDFGDSWNHDIMLEGVLIREKGIKYPRCLAGGRACPPEDCGGTPGYYSMLEIIGDTSHEEHDEMITWLGRPYDPDGFDPGRVKFDNPRIRWKKAFSQ